MAIFNNGYPATYQQMYPQFQQPYQQVQPLQTMAQQQSMQAQNTGIIWIQGEQAAKSFLIAPNTTVPLFDTEKSSIYLKSADASGMPSMKILDYTIRDQNAQNIPVNGIVDQGKGNTNAYVTKAEYEQVLNELEALKAQVESMSMRRASRTVKREETEDEQ